MTPSLLQDSGEESEESIGEQMAKLEELVQKRQQTFNARNVGAEQKTEPAAGAEVADSTPESHDNGSSKSDKFSVPESSAIAETVGPMEYGDFHEDDSESCSGVSGDGSVPNTEDIDASECIAGSDEGKFIPCSKVEASGLVSGGKVGESGDHSDLRKRTPAVIADNK